tara:strand:- start:1291 stop:1908 length:618 start_codon:yes stop_codon:yes gene_type:complete
MFFKKEFVFIIFFLPVQLWASDCPRVFKELFEGPVPKRAFIDLRSEMIHHPALKVKATSLLRKRIVYQEALNIRILIKGSEESLESVLSMLSNRGKIKSLETHDLTLERIAIDAVVDPSLILDLVEDPSVLWVGTRLQRKDWIRDFRIPERLAKEQAKRAQILKRKIDHQIKKLNQFLREKRLGRIDQEFIEGIQVLKYYYLWTL